MGKYVYNVPAGTLDLGDDEPYKAGEAFELDDERAKAVCREVPEVISEEEFLEGQKQNEEAEEAAARLDEAENAARQGAEQGEQSEQAPEVRKEGVQARSRREGAEGVGQVSNPSESK